MILQIAKFLECSWGSVFFCLFFCLFGWFWLVGLLVCLFSSPFVLSIDCYFASQQQLLHIPWCFNAHRIHFHTTPSVLMTCNLLPWTLQLLLDRYISNCRIVAFNFFSFLSYPLCIYHITRYSPGTVPFHSTHKPCTCKGQGPVVPQRKWFCTNTRLREHPKMQQRLSSVWSSKIQVIRKKWSQILSVIMLD